MNDLYFWLLLISLSVLGLTILYFSFRYFEVAIFIVGFSSWMPYILFKNSYEGIMQEEAGIGSYFRIITLILMGVIGLIKFLQHYPGHKGRIPLHFTLMGIFLALTMASIAYSIDQNITFVRSATFISLFLFLLGLYAWIREELQFYKILNTLYYLTLLFIVLSILGTALMPGRVWWWDVSSRFIGIWGHPNTTGIFCLIAYPVLLWKFNESNNYGKIFVTGLIIAVLFMHILTGSRTSLFASFMGIFIWFIVQRKGLKIVIALAVISLFAFVLLQINPGSFERPENRGITDVTGRDQFWQATQLLIGEKPLTGYGYAVEGKVWSDPRFYKKGYSLWSGSNRTSIHNGYLSIAVGVGLVGFLMWILILLIPFIRALKVESNYYKAFAYSVMAMMILENFAESALDSANSIGAIFFWIAWVMTTKLYEFKKEELKEETSPTETGLLTKNYDAKLAAG